MSELQFYQSDETNRIQQGMSSKVLQLIIKETSGTLIHLSVNDFGEWKLYIYKSKKIFVGDLETVCQQAVDEFLTNREPNLKKYFKTRSREYVYAPKQCASRETEPLCNGTYAEKLRFAESLGFKNVAMAIAELGPTNFKLKYIKNKKQLSI